ncbi:serine O-acetyltransferase [Magnetospira sp. QH-2]|uniref:serine O-acetyltransferase n=1 Tax=Magnetospira sp. (strain QH-2) TaxID=1288970 RepID=UPI00208E6605|nr:serine O-acetyltransferase [Magnetospira sp. QH-2]
MSVFSRLKEDIESFIARDPAARSRLEVTLTYPGFHALLTYRLAHGLWRRNWKLSAKLLSYLGRIVTGIEIHPGATIGRRFFIDHGTGVVIGETSHIGDDVTIYHGVTLGGIAPSVDSHEQVNQKRHPTIEDRVIIGSGAQILGPIVIGHCARVGANAVVYKDVEPKVTAVGIPARAVMPRDKAKAGEFQAYGTALDDIPDPVARAMDGLRGQVTALLARVEELEKEIEQQPREAAAQDQSDSDKDQDKRSNVVSIGE